MPAISFQPRWRKQLENGLDLVAGRRMRHKGIEPKLQTLRRPRKRAIRVGDALYLWERQRRPERRYLGEAECLLAQPITIWCDSSAISYGPGLKRRHGMADHQESRFIGVNRSPYGPTELARRDGFEDAWRMATWLATVHGAPTVDRSLDLVLISWDPRRPWEANVS